MIKAELMSLKLQKEGEVKTLNSTVETLQLELNNTKEDLARKAQNNSNLTYLIDTNKKDKVSMMKNLDAVKIQYEEKLNADEKIIIKKQKEVKYCYNFFKPTIKDLNEI